MGAGADTVTTRADALRFTVSSVEVTHLAAVGSLPGLAITSASAANGPGTGALRTTPASASRVQWKAPGSSTWGPAVDVSAGGAALLEDGENPAAFVRVTASASYLPAAGVESRVLLRDVHNNGSGGDDVTANEATAGLVESWSITLEHDGGFPITNLVAWIDAGVSGLEISDDNATWVSPTSEAAGLALANLAPGDTDTIYLRRTVGAGASSDAAKLNHLRFAFDSI